MAITDVDLQNKEIFTSTEISHENKSNPNGGKE